MKAINLTLGEKLSDLLSEASETAAAAAKEMGVSPSLLSDILNDKKTYGISTVNLTKLSSHFGVSTDYLLGISPCKSPEINIQSACTTTGLSEAAVNALARYNPGNSVAEALYNVPQIVSLLLEAPEFASVMKAVAHVMEVKEAMTHEETPAERELLDSSTGLDVIDATRLIEASGNVILSIEQATEYFVNAATFEFQKMLSNYLNTSDSTKGGK